MITHLQHMQIHAPIIPIDRVIGHMVEAVTSKKVPVEMHEESTMGNKLKRASHVLSRKSPFTQQGPPRPKSSVVRQGILVKARSTVFVPINPVSPAPLNAPPVVVS